MQQHTEVTDIKRSNGDTKPRGRIQDGQESVIKLAALRGSIKELVTLHIKRKEAADKLSGAIKAAAEKSGLLAAVVVKFVKARAGDKFEEEKTKVAQLSLVFEEVGEA